MDNWAESENHYSDFQSAFQKNHSTLDNIMILNEVICNFQKQGKFLYAMLLDIQKAFLSVNKRKLFA